MEQIIERISAATGLSPDIAREATAQVLSFFEKNGTSPTIQHLIDSLPGMRETMGAQASESGGGLMGKLGGMIGGLGGGLGASGGLMALAGQLSSKGLNMDQMKGVGKEIFSHAAQQFGPDKAREIFKSVPGVGAMMG